LRHEGILSSCIWFSFVYPKPVVAYTSPKYLITSEFGTLLKTLCGIGYAVMENKNLSFFFIEKTAKLLNFIIIYKDSHLNFELMISH
jgi:hypothetical protein